jgi:hypothetical protein
MVAAMGCPQVHAVIQFDQDDGAEYLCSNN